MNKIIILLSIFLISTTLAQEEVSDEPEEDQISIEEMSEDEILWKEMEDIRNNFDYQELDPED